ncbi:MAG: hypothetical protein IJY46_02360 [Lentisphaeria bacterium]|nr:hypothetical protein [Lentisphaeria bacterium]
MNLKNFTSSRWFVLLLCLIPVAVICFCQLQQHTHQEANCFLVVYNSEKIPLWKLIFDPLRTDWQCYQARELSYLIDALDARFIFFCINKLKMAHFYSLSAVIFALAGAVYLFSKTRKLYPGAKNFIYLLPPLLYTLVNLDSISFFRSSKPAAAFGTTVIFFYFAELLKHPDKYSRFRPHWYAILTILLLPYVDRMGFFVTAVTAAGTILLLALAATPKGKYFQLDEYHLFALRYMTVAATASTFLSVLYNFYLAPWIINEISGYYPSFAFQRLPRGSFINIKAGALFLVENVGHTFTSLKFTLATLSGIIIILCITAAMVKLHRSRLIPTSTLPIWLLSVAAMLLCSAVISRRHPAILAPDVIYGIYFLVFETLLINFITVMLFSTPKKNPLKKVFLSLFCIGIAAQCLILASPADTEGHLAMHRATTKYTIDLLNHPEKEQLHPLPQSSAHLIKFVHKRPGVLPMEKNSSRFTKQDTNK